MPKADAPSRPLNRTYPTLKLAIRSDNRSDERSHDPITPARKYTAAPSLPPPKSHKPGATAHLPPSPKPLQILQNHRIRIQIPPHATPHAGLLVPIQRAIPDLARHALPEARRRQFVYACARSASGPVSDPDFTREEPREEGGEAPRVVGVGGRARR